MLALFLHAGTEQVSARESENAQLMVSACPAQVGGAVPRRSAVQLIQTLDTLNTTRRGEYLLPVSARKPTCPLRTSQVATTRAQLVSAHG